MSRIAHAYYRAADIAGALTRAAAVRPKSINEDARTVECVAATAAAIRSPGAERPDGSYGPHSVALAMHGADVSRIAGAGIPFKKDHKAGTENVVGAVIGLRAERDQLIATIRVDDDDMWDKIAGGTLQSVSVGFVVHEWGRAVSGGDAPTFPATKWELLEISVVDVAADPRTGFRSMPGQKNRAATSTFVRQVASKAANMAPPEVRLQFLDEGLALAERGATEGEIQAHLFNILSKRDDAMAGNTHFSTGDGHGRTLDNPEFRRGAMSDAVTVRAMPSYKPQNDAYRNFAGMHFDDLAKECAEAAGVNTRGMRGTAIFRAALGQFGGFGGSRGAMHTSSDFPLILADAQNKILRLAYDSAPSEIMQLGNKSTANDFRSKYHLKFGEFPPLEKVDEHGEIKRVTVGEARESYAVARYANIFGITEKVLVNDDVDAFSRGARQFGIAARETQVLLFVDLLRANAGLGPTMSDGVTLFHANHGNIPTAAALAVDAIGSARKMLRMQTGLNGQPIAVAPKFLVVPAALETEGEKMLAQLAAARADDVNPFSGRLTLLTEARLDAISATAWYLAAAADFGSLEYSTLEGEEEPGIATREGWDVLGMEMRCTMSFGCGALDWRSLVRNAGV